jgi:hypothetical protein
MSITKVTTSNLSARQDFRQTAKIIIWITISTLLFFVILFFFKTTELNFNKQIKTQIFSDFGGLIGGITSVGIGLATTYLLIQTINESRQQNVYINSEARFFEMLKVHRDNRQAIITSLKDVSDPFGWLISEYIDIYRYIERLKRNDGEHLKDLDYANMAFLLFFFGCLEENEYENRSFGRSSRILKRYVQEDIQAASISSMLNSLSEAKSRKHDVEGSKNLFVGHHNILDHYYRHIFFWLKFIEDQKSETISVENRANYIHLLRSSLSSSEQTLLGLYGLSRLGRDLFQLPGTSHNLITQYNLIADSPNAITKGFVDLKKYYPTVQFTGD